MKLEEQVCSLGSAKRLKELGAKQVSLFWWKYPTEAAMKMLPKIYADYKPKLNEEKWKDNPSSCITLASAFTVSELGELLPMIVRPKGVKSVLVIGKRYNPDGWKISYRGGPNHKIILDENTEAEARAKTLIYLLENKLT